MPLEFILALSLTLFGRLLFRHFESHTPPARTVLKWAVYLGLVVFLTWRVGRPWSLVWTLGGVVPGMIFHFAWCLRHGIHPLTSEPRAKYLALRGWASSTRS
jgi:hypothetical protein